MGNKIVLITGSSRGIGASTALEFAKKGYNVIINYKNNEFEATKVADQIDKLGVETLIVKADISKESDIKKMIETTINKFGKIDVLVNNAGIAIDKDIQDRTVEDFNQTLSTNLIGPFLVSREVAKYMMHQKRGKIINVSSTSGSAVLTPESVDYDCSKVAINTLTRELAYKYAPYINVNAVAPSWVNTEINQTLPKDYIEQETNKIWLKRFAKPEEIAKVIVFLASDDASFINGEVIKVDGGY